MRQILLPLLLWKRAASQFSVLGTISNSSQLDGPWGLAVSDSFLFAALYDGHGLAILDVSSGSSPSVCGLHTNITHMPNARYVALNADATHAYVTADRFFTVLDVTIKTAPGHAGPSSVTRPCHRRHHLRASA